MTNLAFALVVVPAAIWLGAIVFQSAVVASSVFAVLDVDNAGKVLRKLFPRFFILGLVCGVLMLCGLALLAMANGVSDVLVPLGWLSAAMLVCQSIALVLVPRINAARDAGAAGRARFGRLHGASVLLTIAVMLMAIAVLVIVGNQAAVAMVSA